MSKINSIIIIGGGPAGLTSALYAARAGLKPLVFAGSPPGGQLMLTSEVENFPGYSSILGSDLIVALRKQAEAFGTNFIDKNITSVNFSNTLTVHTSEEAYHAKTIIIATGAQALWLGLESETRLRGRGVSACATCDGFFFKEKNVAVVGGGDTAMEEAQTLSKFAKNVYVIHRKANFRASKIMQERVMSNPKIHIIWNSIITEILGETRVTGIRLNTTPSEKGMLSQSLEDIQKITFEKLPSTIIRKNEDSIEWEMGLDGIFISIGHKPDTSIFDKAVQVNEKGYILTTTEMALNTFQNPKIKNYDQRYRTMTSVPGVFAAGDCVDYIYRQAGTAAGMGISAALDAQKYLEGQ